MVVLSYVFSMVLFAVILLETIVSMRARQAVLGSRERYVLLTQRRILSWTVNVGFAIQGVIGLVTGQSLATLSLAFAVYLSWVEVKNHSDDDDWFNGRMKKIGRGLKKAFTVRVRVPAVAPAPAFG
ncbi:hypothetical protein AS850_06215 [Frondihabitans sp. 762G35]|uniref:hypothetical protein n=1 Tax=Frondihabitans sp. 762G35 TaxID=1446794 RepID=UPI000D20B829|nr:hypothetical protein [Frondihabitans sp. 762G35]ARC56667.1 hypothetical protein AS850_06215 [Frondihabitans sp. 762G35]